MSHALVCSSGVLAAPRPAHYRFLRRSRQLVLRSKHALQCIPLRPEGFGLIRCRSTARANWNSVKHHTNLSGRLGSAADAVFCRGPRSDQGRVFACAHNVQQCESDEGHLQDAAKFVLSLRSELDSLERKQLSPACSTAINQLVALCQSGRQEEVAEALAQDMILQEGVFPSLVVLWDQERLSSVAGGLVSNLLLSLLQVLPAHVASSLLPTGEVFVASMPRHWQVLSAQPCMLNPAAFQDAVISSNFKVKTVAALLMLLSLIDNTDQLAASAEAGFGTVVLEQMLQTISSWSVLKDDASSERQRRQSSQVSGEAPAVQPWADSHKVATTLPFVAAARVLETMLYWHQLSAQKDYAYTWCVQSNWRMLIAGIALSLCSQERLPKIAQLCEEDPHKTDYESCLSLLSSEQNSVLSWVEQCRTEFDVDTSKRAEISHMVDTTQLLQLSSKLQKCQILSEEWFANTQGNACKLFVELLRECITMQPSSVQRSQAERNASVRSLMPYLVDMLHHPSEHVRGYAARHMSCLHHFAGDVVASAVLNESSGGLGRLLLLLANSKDFGDQASYASLIGVCSLHCDADVLEELNNAGTCQLVYSLLEQADSDSSRSQLLYSLARLASRSEQMAASIAAHKPVRLLVHILTPTLDETASVQPESVKREVLCGCLKLLGRVLKVCMSSTDLHDDSDLIATATGAMIKVVQKPTLLDNMPDTVHDALGCLHYLTSIPEGKLQALKLPTVDKIEDLWRAALTWLEDDSQPEMHWGIAARLMSMTTLLPEGRQVLAQRRMSGRVAKVFTSTRSEYLQAVLLPVCDPLSVLNQDGSYATSPWLACQADMSSDALVLDIKAAALHALSLNRAIPQPSVKLSGQQRMTRQVQQVGQQSEQQIVQQLDKQPVQQSERQQVQPDPSQGVHGLSPASNVTAGRFFHEVSEDPEARDDDDDDSWWRNEFMKEESGPSNAIPLEVQKVTGKVWYDVLVAAAVRLANSEESFSRQSAMQWLAELLHVVTDEAGQDLVQAGAVQASLQLLQREKAFQPRLDAMQFCLRLHHRGLLPADLLLEANIHQHLVNIFTTPDESLALKTMAASLLRLLWQYQPSLVSQFVSQHPVAAFPHVTTGDDPELTAFGPLLDIAVLGKVIDNYEGPNYFEQLLQLVPWLVGSCKWLLDQHCNGDDAFTAEVLEESLWQYGGLLWSMTGVPPYLSAMRSAGLAVVCARMTGASFQQAESYRGQDLSMLGQELSHKLARADA